MRTLTLAALLTVSLAADTHQVVKTTFASLEIVSSQYTKGPNIRSENLDHNGLPQNISIQKEGIVYRLDLERREYMEFKRDGPNVRLTLAGWIARPPRVHESGKTVHVYYETIDTGESRQMFGQVAKHLLLRERSVAEPGACGATRQHETEGWFIPAEKPRAGTKAYLHVVGGDSSCRDTFVRHGDPRAPGIALYEKSDEMTREMTEFSHDTLNNNLFDVPRGFRKVDALAGDHTASWTERLGMEFSELSRAFETWF